ncbi:methylthioribulose-1-phosphate dehydratase-like isoform X2 [Montipora foliosa]|uniref:methylthioribulose-1-phosphate dehydratase-like isoform X2 n=1 Tax=Montipora foliosa TaxID=591990 RepID=UPI0035F1A1AE
MATLSNSQCEYLANYSKDPEHPRNLIPELCRQFYHLDWVTGTGGGISIKYGDEIFVAPSGVQKERITSEDMFVCDLEENELCSPPPAKKLKKSQCTPLFMNAYTIRGAGAVIHTHSKHCAMATLLYPGKEFRITHQEMIKGMKKGIKGVNYRKAWPKPWRNIPILARSLFAGMVFTYGETRGRKPKLCASAWITCVISLVG